MTAVIEDGYKWVSQICPICEAPPETFLGARGGAAHRANLGVECQIWQCKKCKLIFPNPMPVPVRGVNQNYEIAADQYFEHHDLDSKCSAASFMLKQATELLDRTGSLLDVGCGRGELLRTAREQGWTVIGVEPSRSFADQAARYSGAEVRRNSLECCGFEPESFDAVVLSGVLEHLYTPNETMAEIARILKPGGLVFIDVPNEAGLYFRLGNLYQSMRGRSWVVNLAPTFSPYHVFGFSPYSLRALLAKHALRPKLWRMYGGRSCLGSGEGFSGRVEKLASSLVAGASNIGALGNYIETWAGK